MPCGLQLAGNAVPTPARVSVRVPKEGVMATRPVRRGWWCLLSLALAFAAGCGGGTAKTGDGTGPHAKGGPTLSEAQLVALAEKLGGGVIRDEARPGKPVMGVNLSDSKVSDADLK